MVGIEIDNGRAGVEDERTVGGRENGGALRGETAQLLEEGREGRVEREGFVLPASESGRRRVHVVVGEVAGERRVVVGGEPAPGAHAAVVVEENPLHALVVALAHVVEDALVA